MANERAICPECGSVNVYYRKTLDSWRCRKCGINFDALNVEDQDTSVDGLQINEQYEALLDFIKTELPYDSLYAMRWLIEQSSRSHYGEIACGARRI